MPFKTVSYPIAVFRDEQRVIEEAVRRGDKTYVFYMTAYRDGDRKVRDVRLVPSTLAVRALNKAVYGLMARGFSAKQIINFVKASTKTKRRKAP